MIAGMSGSLLSHDALEDLLQRPGDVWLFSLVLVVAGGLREEVQRAFILRRFERELGGALVGLVLFMGRRRPPRARNRYARWNTRSKR